MGTRAWGRRGGYRPRPGAPQAIPGPLPTADPAPPSLSHPQHNHTTTHHPATPRSHPAPPATQSRPAPPTTYSAEKILHICFPAVPESLQPNDTPGRPNQKQIPSSAGIHRTPHPPQARSAAWLRAKLLPISHPGVQGCHPGTVGSLAPSLGVAECAAHPAVNTQGHRDPPPERKGPPCQHPHLPRLIFLSIKTLPILLHGQPQPRSWTPPTVFQSPGELPRSVSHHAMLDTCCQMPAAPRLQHRSPDFTKGSPKQKCSPTHGGCSREMGPCQFPSPFWICHELSPS